MNNKFTEICFNVISALISAALTTGLCVAGYFAADGDSAPFIATAVICALTVILAAVINSAQAKKISKKIRNMKGGELYDLSMKLKTGVERNYAEAEKGVRNAIRISYAYLFFLIAVHLLYLFAIGGYLSENTGAGTAFVLLGCYSLWGLIDVLILPPVPVSSERKNELPKEKFPLLYGLAKRAASQFGIKRKIILYAGDEGIFVNLQRGKVAIHIDYLDCAVLTADELYSVMLHEFAHVANSDSGRGAYLTREQRRWIRENNIAVAWLRNTLLELTSMNVYFKSNIYNTFAERHHEQLADAEVKKRGNPQDYANALAKSGLISRFRSIPRRELDFDFYAPEEPTSDYAERECRLYGEYIDKYGKKWLDLFDKELPAKVDSHPTVKTRIQATGCESYDAFTAEKDENYIAETRALVALSDEMMKAASAPRYSEMRERNYTKPKKIMNEYDEAVADGKELSLLKRLKAFKAFAGIDDDKALSISAKLLEIKPEHPKVNYITGEILFHRLDRECVKYFSAACRDVAFLEDATSYIGRFALMTGDENLRDEYRKSLPDKLDELRQKQDDLYIDKDGTVLKECGFDGEEKGKLTEGVLDAVENGLSELYVCRFTNGNDKYNYAVMPVFKEDKGDNKFNRCILDIDDFLSFFLSGDFVIVYGNSPTVKLIKDFKPSLIYKA